jgi:DNA-binding transcriptional LysR family regulator
LPMRKQSDRRAVDRPGARVADGGGSGALDDVAALVVFAQVIQQRSFTRAAHALDTSTSTVSKRIARLERRLGAALLTRTTRHVSPTEAGLGLYEHCLRILREVEDAESLVAGFTSVPRGLLRISAPVHFGELHVAPLLADLARRYPDLRLDLSLNDRFVDLTGEGFDLAVRVGALSPSSLGVRKLARDPLVACAAPAYLDRRGTPQHPRDLVQHDCLRYTLALQRGRWRFRGRKGEPLHIPVTGGFDSDHSGALRVAACAGLGIVYLPGFYLNESIERGALVRILADFSAAPIDIQAVYPSRKLLPAKTRLCLDFLARELPKRMIGRRDLGLRDVRAWPDRRSADH